MGETDENSSRPTGARSPHATQAARQESKEVRVLKNSPYSQDVVNAAPTPADAIYMPRPMMQNLRPTMAAFDAILLENERLRSELADREEKLSRMQGILNGGL